MAVRWLAETTDDRGAAARVGRDGDELVAEWIGIARLTVARDGSNLRFVPAGDADPAGIEKIRQGIVALLLRHLEGKLGLHAAAVAFGGRAAILVGASGRGKSTLAAYACARRGAAFVSDDAVAVDRDPSGWCAVPLERDHWLDDEARRAVGLGAASAASASKSPQRAALVAPDRSPIGAIMLLEWADVERPRLARLRGIAAIAALVPLLVRFVVDDADLQRRELDLLSDLVERVPIVRVERPHGLAHLPATLDAIAAALEGGSIPS